MQPIEYINSYNGALATLCANGDYYLIPRSKYFEVSPSITYEIVSPYFNSMTEERQHRQIADKAFEAKSRKALLRYLDERDPHSTNWTASSRQTEELLLNGSLCLSWGVARYGFWNANIASLLYPTLFYLTLGCGRTTVASFGKVYEHAWKTLN